MARQAKTRKRRASNIFIPIVAWSSAERKGKTTVVPGTGGMAKVPATYLEQLLLKPEKTRVGRRPIRKAKRLGESKKGLELPRTVAEELFMDNVVPLELQGTINTIFRKRKPVKREEAKAAIKMITASMDHSNISRETMRFLEDLRITLIKVLGRA